MPSTKRKMMIEVVDTVVEKWKDDVQQAVKDEIRLTTAVVDACVKAGVKHLVYSTLDDLPDSSYVPHCWAKSQGELLRPIEASTSSDYVLADPLISRQVH